MCGLVALLDTTGPAAWDRVAAALQAIRHRGPDGEGMAGIDAAGATVAAGTPARLIFGFRRLSILDFSSGADQPMRCPETGNLLVFNGEIYNFIELRAELESCGHRFRTTGDTEVILAGWREWGEKVFTRLNGMWAILLYDAASGAMFASRDRMGVKPLYFGSTSGQLAFGSEIRTVLMLLGQAPVINRAAAFDFLAGIVIDHDDQTLYAGIVPVPAGGLWRIGRDGSLARGRYHDWPRETAALSLDHLRDLLTDAVRLRLRSDAPTVSLLSGGLDSSLITWLAAAHGHDPRTCFAGAFSYGYDDPAEHAHDETERARRLIAALPEPLAHTIVQMSAVPRLDELLAMTAVQELPSTTPSIIASYRLYQQIRAQNIKVAISGEGADELFGGYTRLYLPLLAVDELKQLDPAALAALLRSPYLSTGAVLRRLAWELPAAIVRPLLRRQRPNVAAMAPGLWHGEAARFAEILALNRLPVSERLRADVVTANMPELLRYADRNSMAASVELRLPFMDYRLVEYALSLPVAAKLGPAGGKQALRHAFAGIVPDSVLAQPKTHGFGNAEQYRVLQMPLGPLIEQAPAETWDFIDRATLVQQLAKKEIHPMVWLPVSFALWTTTLRQAA